MSDVLFPELPGLEWDTSITPMFNTKIMTSINGRELRASFQASPKYEISLSYAFLRENKGRKELQQLQGFYLERRGAFDSFLYKMPDDNEFSCTFIGDGTATTFQLYKDMYTSQLPLGNTEEQIVGEVDPNMWNQTPAKTMWNTNQEKLMWNNATAQITSDGKYVLSQPIEEGVKVTVTGTFYYRCRFKDDTQQYVNFMHKLWKAGKVELIGSLGNKI
ncbi:DUF2460 domain-containing protein [Acinetobacter baumannii]|uniref:DUF2460 domain-containing protein n=2 Tax=Acinetobacter baumannii TaxID=470 RepID=A0A8I0K7F3_ACIBA|nr:DUF2460 domain-containing protein [Acinetobacter baumannii]EMT83226.1 hypothetical protein ABNIH5_19284 [Acinetobacter baumannii ABNIH5]ETY70302.1 hypothetical protein X964_00770 [Acinetobacter baumannii MDR_MMC4]EXD24814.1 hypothetical protein J480_1406 [Acinetobacter baumannii 34654]EYU48898.1 hypothetical protein J616_02441 [Acinetobacter baumannii 1457504]KCX51332.1 hypothetical protein J528_3794 [Acinetobacter baumannii 135867]KCX86791.1 hypothetical protein J530_3815 [Acinetobacter b